VFLNKCDMIKDMEMLEVIEMELKELLKKHEYDPDKVKFVKGSALHAINDTEPELGEKKIMELLDVMDNHIPLPERLVDKPFMMSI
jgi:elongation factor Tu